MMLIIIQILLYQGLFLLVYQLIKKEPFFQLNRFYLLFTLIASFALPFVEWNWFQFSVETASFQKLNTIYLPEVVIGNDATSTTKNIEQQASIQYLAILENLYFLGFSVAVSLLYIKIEGLIQLIQENNSLSKSGCKLVYLKGEQEAFSFYNYVFIGEEICPKQQISILAHEQQHVKLKHSLDNSLVAVLRVLMWFNPLLYYYQKELQLLHEYQADAKACEQCNPKTYAWQLLNAAFQTKNMSLMSSFYNKSFIKNRITMLQKKNKNSQSIFKYALVTPILLVAFSFNLIAQSNFPKDEQALLDKYKKEVRQELKKDVLTEKDFERLLDLEHNENGDLTKNGFYKLKAVYEVIDNEYNGQYKIIGKNSNMDYDSYISNPDKTKLMFIFSTENLNTRELSSNVNHKKQNVNVPFAAVDRVPIYPGCDESLSNEELRNCMSEKIRQHVNTNFNTSLLNTLGMEGETRIYVRFAIASDGNIDDVKSRSAHPNLSDEGTRLVNSLPKMKPGIHKKEAVNVIYTLPITLMIPEKEETEGK